MAQERLVRLRAAAKVSPIEDQQDLLDAGACGGFCMEGLIEHGTRAGQKALVRKRRTQSSADEEDKKKRAAIALILELELGHECVVCIEAPPAVGSVALVPADTSALRLR